MHGPTITPDTINATPEAVLATKPNDAARSMNLSDSKSATARTADHVPSHTTSAALSSAAHNTAETVLTSLTPAQDEAAHTSPKPAAEDNDSTSKHPATSRTFPREPSTAAPGKSPTRARNMRRRSNKWLHYAITNGERGMSTAEYAVGTIAACAFAALLFKVVSSPEVQEMLTALIDRALKTNSE
jgi:hypothetical protein